MPKKWDFSGWATKNDLKCADGRIIKRDAFRINNGQTVPLIWNHQHNDPLATLGHAVLENRDEGVYAYGYFNDSPIAEHAKSCIKNGDINALSIWANNLEQNGPNVMHGVIREVSLVHAGANPGAVIESVLAHGIPLGEEDDEAILYCGEGITLAHAEWIANRKNQSLTHAADNDDEEEGDDDMTVGEVLETLDADQKKAVAILISQAVNGDIDDEEEGDDDMRHNLFEGGESEGTVLSHSDMQQIFADARRIGSLKEAVEQNLEDGGVLAHAIDTTGMTTATGKQTYGFNDVDMLFPDYKSLNNPPEWISRNMDWVSIVMNGVHHTPFSRIKSVYANITEDEARARGYIKGKQKKEEVFTTLKRTTDPQTIYKKQKLDRDDIIDITDFDVVAWIKAEMRVMLDEEIARAILIGDGRQADSDDKIQENHIRPIVSDVPLYNITQEVASSSDPAEFASTFIDTVIRTRKQYKGSGNPTLFTTEDVLTEMLLLKDGIGHKLYKTEAEVATALRVSRIVTVEVMEGAKVNGKDLLGVIVNLADYNVGADKGGAISMFDDFDIDYNQQKYLIETRISGALIKPFSAMTFVKASSTTSGSGSGSTL